MIRVVQVVLVTVILSVAAVGQVDPPSRVGRLSYASGSVSLQPAGVADWATASINRPLTTGDTLWADSDARAEISIGTASLRIASRTAVQILNLDDRAVQIRLSEGVLSIHLRELAPDEVFEVDTPNQAFSLLRPGDYRIEADPDSQTTAVIVFQGQGEVTGGGQAINVPPGTMVQIRGDQEITYDTQQAPEPDAWDRWCMDRIQRDERSQAMNYVAPEVIGYQDLDNYGVWNESPYGMVWEPRTVVAGWAPYQYGHWVWIEPWGWTWVDDAPWGFAPFHYGRWAYWNRRWVWAPGPRTVRPCYSPAMVAWVGGANWGVSVSLGGGVGWVPLGPREVYYPGYRYSPGYLNRINHSNTVITNVNITNVYVNNDVMRRRYMNMSAPNGFAVVPQRDLASGRPVRQMIRHVDYRQLQGAQVIGTAPVVPGRGAVLGPGGGGRVVRPPDAVMSRRVVVRTMPPSGPGSFEERQRAMQRTPGVPGNYGGNREGGTRMMVRQAPAVTQPPIQARPGMQNRPSPEQGTNEQRRGWRTVTPQGQMPSANQPRRESPQTGRPVPGGQPGQGDIRYQDQRGGWRTQQPQTPGTSTNPSDQQRRQQQDMQRQQQEQQRQQQNMERRRQQDEQRQQQEQQRQQQNMEQRRQQDEMRQRQQEQRQQQDMERRRQQDEQRQRQQQEQQRQQQEMRQRQQQEQQRQQQQQQQMQRRQQDEQRQRQQEEMRQQRERQQQERQQHEERQRETRREKPNQN